MKSLSELFKHSASTFVNTFEKFRTQTSCVNKDLLTTGSKLEMFTPAKCWSWSVLIYSNDTTGARYEVPVMINGQICTISTVNFTTFPLDFPGQPYIERNDKIQYVNNILDSGGNPVELYFKFRFHIVINQNT